MRNSGLSVLFVVFSIGLAAAAPKPHVVSFGKAIIVKWLVGADEAHAIDLKVRALYVDGRLKEYTTGTAHDVTDRLFVVQRAYRLNDSLHGEAVPRWIWQRGGWLLADRLNGRISPLNLPAFDPYYSAASWFRDYVAYCAISEDGKRGYAVVAQLGRRKPILKGSAWQGPGDDNPDSACPAPAWQRHPSRVTFEAPNGKLTYEVTGHGVDLVKDQEEEDAASE